NFTISNNYIGGSSAICGGTPWTKTNAKYNNFTCIKLYVGSGTASNIQGNTIKNFSHSDASNAASTYWQGIYIQAGTVNIGTTTANTIGASTGTGSITYTSGSGSASAIDFLGIRLEGNSIIDVQNNVIGSITTDNLASTNRTNFTGIYILRSGTINISGNTIGSTTTANSIYANSLSTSSAQTLYGINNYSGSGSTIRTISGNTISNMTNANTGTLANSYTCGMRFSRTIGTKTVTNNTIRDLSTACGWNSAYYSPLTGISMEAYGTEAQTVTGNTIYNLTNNYSSTGTSVCGILFKGSTSPSNTLSGNFIYNLSCLTAGNDIRGLILYSSSEGGTTTCANNILSLGGVTPANIYGLYEHSGLGTHKLYFNTVYIGGTLSSGSTNSYSFYSAVYSATLPNTRNFRNNIFINARSNGVATGKHFAVYLAYTVNTNLTINYNDYFTSGTGGMLGYHTTGTYNSANDISTLVAWKTATGQDANSMNTNPLFTGAGGTTASDYKTTDRTIIAQTGTGITTDYAGITRSISYPTMGAYENDNPLPVSLSSFTSALNGRDVKLSWITSSEQNNSGFNIERKSITGDFAKIGFVNGKGTVNTPSSYSFEDKNLQTGKYQYRLKQIDNNGNFEFHNLNGTVEVGIPNKFDLSQNYPNPFNPTTKINFDLPADSKVTLVIYDVTGRQVSKLLNNELRTAGYYTMDFNGSSFASGIYFYRFIAESAGRQTVISKRMTLIK
ncbi:MAG: T9SS type A sorting domain-containing protein, partial [Ignavibacteriae bacterium]|nr:T9SS type A sorting domain-containing protein [Ignavibacteriota bacterium]